MYKYIYLNINIFIYIYIQYSYMDIILSYRKDYMFKMIIDWMIN